MIGNVPLHRYLALSALLVAALTSGCAGEPSPAPTSVGQFASANPGSVNTFWLTTERGLVVIDAQRSLGDARKALADLRHTGKPVAAILITHPHPDHVGGIGVLHDAFPDAPVHASQKTVDFMRTDPLGFYELTRSLPGSDFPAELTVPDRIIPPNKPVDAGGLRLDTVEFGQGESTTMTVYYEPRSRALFAGDLVANRATPAMLEGHTCAWLTQLDELRTRFPDAARLYPGHGEPGDAATLIDEQRDYLRQFRRLVRAAVAPASASGATVSAEEMTAIIADLPDYPSVASLPTLPMENVKAVANELATEQPACSD